MPSDAQSYPADASEQTFLLTVRGTAVPASLDETRTVHNATAGAPPSVAGARALGDLSHNVYTGRGEELAGELLFIDFWNSLSGLGQFFANPQVEQGAAQLFSSREGVVWAGAPNFGDVHLAVPSGRPAAGVGILRTEVTSMEKAAVAFRAYAASTINEARTHGIVSHSVWTRVPDPGHEPAPEVIAIDVWMDGDEMGRYYDLGVGFEHLGPVFAGRPDTSTWLSAAGDWTEW
ncbi:MAG TPA: hypothetical protein VF005_07580 [Acidimicrobiales bacterium]